MIQRAGSRRRCATGQRLMCVVGILATAAVAAGEATDKSVTPNFKDADLAQIAETVSAVTGKDFVLDPRVHAQVTMLSSKALNPQAFYQAFLAILQVNGYIAVPSG